MGIYYLDSSALVKRYTMEAGTPWIMNLTDPTQGNVIYSVRISGAEIIAAFYRKVRIGSISKAEAILATTAFKQDWQTQYRVFEVTASIVERAMTLIESYNLRGFDAVHLAAVLEATNINHSLQLPPPTFVTADNNQLQAAVAESLQTENPNNYYP